MALWQFDVQFVRTDRLTLDSDTDVRDASRLVETDFEGAKGYLDELGLPEAGVTVDWLVFGDPKGNRFDLCWSDEGSAEISARIDATEESDAFCILVCVLALDLGCDLWSSELNSVLKPTREALFAALMASDAWKYALDPARYATRKL